MKRVEEKREGEREKKSSNAFKVHKDGYKLSMCKGGIMKGQSLILELVWRHGNTSFMRDP